MSDVGAEAMRAYIADHPKGKDGIHRYRPEEYGVDPAIVRKEFAPVHRTVRPRTRSRRLGHRVSVSEAGIPPSSERPKETA